jgi:hypothetical protein
MLTEDKAAYAINEWCVEARISPSLYFKEHKNGRGPFTANIGRRTIIVESPSAFFKRRERESASAGPAIREIV